MTAVLLKLSLDEVWPLSNILNEVCNGFRVRDFEKRISVKESMAEGLLRRIGDLLRSVPNEEYSKVRTIELEPWEIEVILNAMKEVYKQIDDWEFGIRLGIEIPEMQAIERKLRAALESDVKIT